MAETSDTTSRPGAAPRRPTSARQTPKTPRPARTTDAKATGDAKASKAAKPGASGASGGNGGALFQPVVAPTRVDYPLLEEAIQRWWDERGIMQKYLHRNDTSERRFSFIDGPITANNPMGVHHGWGRTYKDLWQRFNT
ncbi:MAG TPA: hypothetical protein VID72_13970, partial [Ktedonobacterales bacterium]